MNREVFRKYDVRGVVETDFEDGFIRDLGRSIGSYLAGQGGKRMAVGRDCRLSSDGLRDLLVEGILSTGVSVVDIGTVPTPLLYFAMHELEVDGGVMITGSHNPPEYNGFKIGMGKSTIYGPEIQKLADIIEKADYPRGQGSLSQNDIIPAYIDQVAAGFRLSGRDLCVAVDAGNGTGGVVAVPLLEKMGVKVKSLFCEMDGHFPNHHPDPTMPENLEDLIREVRASNLPAGIAFDGDADRLGVVDDKGEIVWGDKLMILFSRQVLADKPGATVIGEVKCSKTMYDDITAHGGNAVMYKTGHSLIKAKMKEIGAPLAGEMSGHTFFADEFPGYDDALYATCRFARLLAAQGKSLAELVDELPVYYATPEVRVDCPEEKKVAIVEQMTAYFKAHYDANDIDGVRILFGDGWGLIRASNTQPVLVLRFEAQTPERLQEIQEIVLAKLHEIAPEVEVPL
jgi:phosphomannomutase/phosphoglucomutase